MKTINLLASLLLAVSGHAAASGSHAHGHEHKPLHGGVVVEASDMDFELVAKADAITIHVRDHGKPASVKGATGKVTVLTGTEKSEAPLAPAGDDRLQATGTFKVATGTKVVALVNLPGKKPVNVRFAIK